MCFSRTDCLVVGVGTFVTVRTGSAAVAIWSLVIAVLQTIGLVQIFSFKTPSTASKSSTEISVQQTIGISRVSSAQIPSGTNEEVELTSTL